MFLNVVALNVCTLLFGISSMNEKDRLMTFTVIWFFACCNYVFLAHLQHLITKCLLIVISLSLRCGLLISTYNGPFIVDFFVLSILIDLFIIVVLYSAEKKERRIFENFYEHRLELTKFKDLIENYLPQNVTILSSKDQSSLFANKAFVKLFTGVNNIDASPDFSSKNNTMISQKTLKTQFSQTMPDIHSLDLKIHAVRQLEMPETVADVPQNIPDLKAFLQNIIDKEFFGQGVFSLRTSAIWHGVQRSFDAIITPIIWDREEAVAIVLNETTYQENMLALKLADRNKDLVIATVSHELRTPLNGIIGILQIVETKAVQPEVLDYLSLCKDNATLLLNLVNSILDLQQIRDRRLKLNLSDVNICKLVEDTVRLFHYQATQKQLSLKLEIDDDIPDTIHTDENRVKQILINLIGNALKFTIAGEVTVQIKPDNKDNNCIKIIVFDTGIGIKDEDKEGLFKMYGKSEGVPGINKNGVGLGLTISNSLAKVLGGAINENKGIEMESSFGIGSKFGFKLLKDCRTIEKKIIKHSIWLKDEEDQEEVLCSVPSEYEPIFKTNESGEEVNVTADIQSKLFKHVLRKRITLDELGSSPRIMKVMSSDNLIPTRPSSHDEDIRRVSKFKTCRGLGAFRSEPSVQNESSPLQMIKGEVLIVDDNPFNLMIAKSFVEDLGYYVKTVMGGQEAISAVQNNEKDGIVFKFILMDCQMPIMDGFEATRILVRMMKNNEVKRVPIIALTANNSEDDIKRCLDCGMVGHLAKPLFIEDLKNSISKLNI